MKRQYQPDRGDFIYLDFDPQAGREQAGRRPALVLSPLRFNVAVGLALVCPVTHQMKGGPFEVSIPPGSKLTGAVLSEHLRSVDWLARRAEFAAKAPKAVLEQVLGKLSAVLLDS